MAGEVKLFEHPEFEQAVLRAAAAHDFSEQFVEKDYYVTEILRIVVDELGEKTLFKGGTSLSKGWNLIKRFSEDIDLFVSREAFDSPPGKKRMDRILKDLTAAVARHPALTWQKEEGETIGGRGRNDLLAYETRFDALPGIRAAVRLKSGIQSGTFPSAIEPITSFVGQYLLQEAPIDFAGVVDLEGFEMSLLHYRRTFVEKMFAIHSKVVRLLDEDEPLGRDARHYPDLYVLAGEQEVRSMLATPEYEEIKLDYDEKSSQFFPNSHRPPENLSFAASPALFPEESLHSQLSAEYGEQCELLFSQRSDYPDFDAVLARFQELRNLL